VPVVLLREVDPGLEGWLILEPGLEQPTLQLEGETELELELKPSMLVRVLAAGMEQETKMGTLELDPGLAVLPPPRLLQEETLLPIPVPKLERATTLPILELQPTQPALEREEQELPVQVPTSKLLPGRSTVSPLLPFFNPTVLGVSSRVSLSSPTHQYSICLEVDTMLICSVLG